MQKVRSYLETNQVPKTLKLNLEIEVGQKGITL
jgi:hypothetical protein